MKRFFKWTAMTAGAGCLCFLSNAAMSQTAKEKLYVAGNQSSQVYVIDTATNELIETIDVGAEPHGLASRNGILWVSAEQGGVLNKIDTRTDQVVGSYPIGDYPNESAITDDGKFLYVPMWMNACWFVFDTQKNTVVDKIAVPGGLPHNTMKGIHDKRYMYFSPMGGTAEKMDFEIKRRKMPFRDCDGKDVATRPVNSKVFKLDTRTNRIVGSVDVETAPRPIAVNADGSRLYVDSDDFLGIVVVDTGTMKVLSRVALPKLTPEQQGGISHVHGVAVQPGKEEVWQTSTEMDTVYAFKPTATSLEYIAQRPSGQGPHWLSFNSDGSRAYSSNTGDDTVSVFDTSTHREIARIQLPKGAAPKTNLVVEVRAARRASIQPTRGTQP